VPLFLSGINRHLACKIEAHHRFRLTEGCKVTGHPSCIRNITVMKRFYVHGTYGGGTEMKPIASIIAALAISAIASTAALAACPNAAGSAKTDTKNAIAKDGTKAPMQDSANSTTETTGASTGTTTTSSSTNKTDQKSGDTMPMAADKNQATSGQDVQAQQKGDKSAAAGASAADKDCES
jgi:hypothetical protein